MEIQPPRRRAAQAIGVVVVVAGALLLATSLAFVSGLILEIQRGRRGLLIDLAIGLLGVILLILGKRLLSWGSGDRT
jgi:protein-S-isoprenylcysteine O-methyltransferase Ste14